jgi:hypothetical protein
LLLVIKIADERLIKSLITVEETAALLRLLHILAEKLSA